MPGPPAAAPQRPRRGRGRHECGCICVPTPHLRLTLAPVGASLAGGPGVMLPDNRSSRRSELLGGQLYACIDASEAKYYGSKLQNSIPGRREGAGGPGRKWRWSGVGQIVR